MAKKITHYDRKRLARRDGLWEDPGSSVYNRRNESGFTTVPRTLSMICTLLKYLGTKNDPSGVYLELWTRQRDDGFVEIDDPDEVAVSAGFYRGTTRRVRSLREALDQLAELGFVRIAGKGPRKYAFVLLLHPHDVLQRLRHEKPALIPDWWWELFKLRIQEIGAQLRWKPTKPKKEPKAEEFDDFPESLDLDDDDLPV